MANDKEDLEVAVEEIGDLKEDLDWDDPVIPDLEVLSELLEKELDTADTVED